MFLHLTSVFCLFQLIYYDWNISQLNILRMFSGKLLKPRETNGSKQEILYCELCGCSVHV